MCVCVVCGVCVCVCVSVCVCVCVCMCVEGGGVHLLQLQPFVTRNTTFVTSCLLTCTQIRFWRGVYSMEANIPFKAHTFSESSKINFGVDSLQSSHGIHTPKFHSSYCPRDNH